MNSSTTAELVLIPTPGMGHLLSTVELAKLIVHRHPHVSVLVLIINLPIDSTMVNDFVDSQSRDHHHNNRLTFLSLPSPSDPLDLSSATFFQTLVELHKPLAKRAVEDRVKAGSPWPAAFILDMFCTPMIDVAAELQVPSYIFFTSGASLLNLMFHLQSLVDDQGVDIEAEFGDPDAELDAPGFKNRILGKVVPQVFLDNKHGGCSMILNHARRLRESKGILVNTFTELESSGTQALLDQAAEGNIPAVYPVGPILHLSRKGDASSIIEWLDKQPSSSVVFLCFGSMGSFGADQVREIATGLENSGHRFLWSLRKPPREGKFEMPNESETFLEALPEGFMDRTAQRGRIIGWAPQVSILAHEAIGGFVSHCGWNSTLESLWFGVPMATWPMYAEQQLNAFELVKEMGLAVEIRMDYKYDWRTRKKNFTVTAEEIENGVKNVMSMEEEMRRRVKEMRDQGRKALEEGGSSHNWLGRFIHDVLDTARLN